MKQTRLTPTAIVRTREIALWTINVFGKAQADAYERLLFDAIDDLADGKRTGRSCAFLAEGRSGAERLKYLRVSQHYLIYAEYVDEIVVLDILHGAQNLPALLEALTAANDAD